MLPGTTVSDTTPPMQQVILFPTCQGHLPSQNLDRKSTSRMYSPNKHKGQMTPKTVIYPATGLSQTVTIDASGTGIAKDNLTVDGALYTPCVKPFAGTDQQLVCSGTTQITSATLAATAVTGGSWSQVGNTPNVATITNTTLANSTITGLVPGTYKFVWSTKTDCSDTVSVFVPNCGCVSTPPLLIGGNPQVCIGDTFPTLKVSIVGTGTVDWYSVSQQVE